jgi:hypothetical protein
MRKRGEDYGRYAPDDAKDDGIITYKIISEDR